MACIHIKHYPRVKDLIYPNITDNIDYYKKANLQCLPEHHGCSLRNRNVLNKRVDYSRVYQCILPTSKPYWRKTKDKHKHWKFHDTRYKTQYNIRHLARVKGYYYYNHIAKEYKYQDYWIKKIGRLITVVVTETESEAEKGFDITKENSVLTLSILSIGGQ